MRHPATPAGRRRLDELKPQGVIRSDNGAHPALIPREARRGPGPHGDNRGETDSRPSVFNHFPTKEDLVYDETTSVEEELLQTVRERPVGESVLAAVGRFWLERFDRIAATDATAGLTTMARLVTASPALQARERQIFDRYRDSLASLIANETGAAAGDLEPRVAATALVDLQRALLDAAREKVLLGRRGARLARELRSEGERALALLERGLGRYAIGPRR
jgi:AcrR family transcriptional regulator